MPKFSTNRHKNPIEGKTYSNLRDWNLDKFRAILRSNTALRVKPRAQPTLERSQTSITSGKENPASARRISLTFGQARLSRQNSQRKMPATHLPE
jgi:hypothetical protein